MQEDKLHSLEGLPEFSDYPFDGKTITPVFEIARITGKALPQTNYNLQDVFYVVGRSPDLKKLYYSTTIFIRKNREILAVHGSCADEMKVDRIKSYEIMVPHSKLLESIEERRI